MKANKLKEIQRLIEGWKKYAPAEKFAGLTVQEFEAKFEVLLELLRVMDVIRNEYSGKIAVREGLAYELATLLYKVVDAIKGHKDFGKWSEFYRFLGYKTPDERRSPSQTEESEPSQDNPEPGSDLPQAA